MIDGKYQLQSSVAFLPNDGEMVWMPEIGLGIGCECADLGDWQREWVYWYDRSGKRFPTARERATHEHLARLQAEQKAKRLEEKLRSLGINPDEM